MGLFRLVALHSDNPGFPEGFELAHLHPSDRLLCSSSVLLAPSQPGCPSCGILGESPPPLSLSPLPREVLQHPSCAVRAGVQIRVGSERPCPSHHTHTPWHTVRGQQRQDKGRNSPPGPHASSRRHPPDPQPGCQSQTRVPLLIHRGSTQTLGPAALCQGLHTCFHVSLTTPRQSGDQNPRFT